MTAGRPLPNRVAPDGGLLADSDRGLLMGNRGGRFHDPATRGLTGRLWAGKAWICCRLAFKGRSAPPDGVWGARRYTELFFLDEVTALAAGHRPCMECRRADALAWRAAALRGLGHGGAPLRFPNLDRLLDAERRDGRAKRTHERRADDLPDGAMVLADDGAFLAFRGETAMLWTTGGYGARRPRPPGRVIVLTPPTTLAALAGGYAPAWHPSATTTSLARDA